ncbi:hypothetical protein PFJ87_04g01430 [Encephalitozoon hellem]|uniref:Hpc2-related domain-containing protein n=1 Tax=Encephalitozoon hellem TaxID=27973 RepID=A0ABY8CLQ4_ENCHE|nr:hypothetical protein PFJ87_04g01430 [Encephalitozoon hellem]
MSPENEVTIRVNIMESKEIDLGKKEKLKKRRQRVDDYDYNDPLIEPFEGETQMVMIECSLEDFFVYKGELPYSAKKVLSVHKARERAKLAKSSSAGSPDKETSKRKREMKEKPKKLEAPTGKRRRGKIPKSDTKICDSLANLIKSEIEDLRNPEEPECNSVECYVSLKVLEEFQKEREADWSIPASDTLRKPTDEEMAEYLKRSESAMNETLNAISEEIRNYQLYSDDLSLFKGFQKEDFLLKTSKYFLLFIKISFMSQEGTSFNKARKEAYSNVLDLFPEACRNATQTQYYLAKYISQICKAKGFAEDDKKHDEGSRYHEASSDLDSAE